MDKISINKNDSTNIFRPLLFINDNFDLSIYKNDCDFSQTNDLNLNLSSLPLIDPPMIEQFDKYNIKDINQKSDIFSKDTSNNTGSILQKKRNKSLNKQEEKEDIDKYSKNTLICRVKKIIFDSILNYDNYIISKMYNNKIGNGINIKKLFKTNHFQVKCSGSNFNKELLKKTQGEIFSSSITTKYKNYPLDHNKQLIKKLLNEENKEKRKIFENVFNKTLLECIEHLIGKKEYEGLEGLEKFYENEIINVKLDQHNKELLKIIINNYENIINNKKPRKKKTKKED